MLNFSLKLTRLAAFTIVLAGCQSAGTGALDLNGYPNINVVPAGEVAPISPQQEYDMLAKLNSAIASQPVQTANDRALFEARRKRLAQIAATHAVNTARIIEAR